ncbi:hypothetical protein SARC_11530 [Sphaeroforma arctica JP610]|uniref:Major facilitator superfamily (MFS) profile domain-containing protein n=1 Tax=Sphaeroforma arctica JP610 TaxID=667725 RepID=A0A0L0FHK5_9EUKA|nr:hypothetical protein SARC_11530 [Sphaeroforma arctica JP610]KNC75951.1 hypothetical protein SARC_11530 [Sphaeroforma arctica JP610]|eukprot:XP_014149853.1 hypothetical protein SARC_11530 [Sphaeroforma arctica JP610]
MSLFMLSRTAFVTSTVDDDHRGRIMSILGFIRRLMALFAPIVAGFIAHYTMSSNVFFLQIILCVVYGLWAFYYIPVGVGKNATLHRRGSTGSVDADSALGLGEYSSILEDGDAIIGGDGHEAAISHALITNDGQIHTNETFYSGAGEKRDWCGQCECVAKLFGPVIRQVRKYAITVGLYWKHLLLVGTYCQVMNTVRQSRVLLIPLQATGMGLSDLTVSVIVGIGWGMDALFAPVSGYMMDRHGRLFCGCLTGLVMAASFFILAGVSIMYPPMEGASLAAELEGTAPLSAGMSNSTTSGTDETLTAGSHTSTEAVAAILIASMAMGISNGASGGLILTLSSDIAQLHPRRRGEFLALFMVIVDTGFIFGPYVAGAIANAVGIAWSSAAVGVLSIASSLWMLLLIPETKGMGARYRQFLEDRANEADLMRDTPVGTEYDEPENTKTEESGPRSLQGGPNS